MALGHTYNLPLLKGNFKHGIQYGVNSQIGEDMTEEHYTCGFRHTVFYSFTVVLRI